MRTSPLFTDLYQLTMMNAYLKSGKTGIACFELFVRKLPENRNYLVFAGLEEVVELLQDFHFSREDLDYLHSLKLFPDDFFDYLKEFRFTGSLYAMREGEIFFHNEPVLRVEAPIHQAQLFETAIMNQVHVSSLIATKAARIYSVSRGKSLADFSLRRTHGFDAGMKVARNSYLAGFDATSNVLAGMTYGIPVVGTVAHSFIMAFESEEEAFRAYLHAFPGHGVLLVDTYDTVEGVKSAIRTAKEMNVELKAVRLDSGDVVKLSRITRRLLDESGFTETKIIVSGGLDEYRIDEILKENAPVDAFGVGTKMGTSSDSPYIDFVYKMVEFEGKPVMKTSAGKRMYPGRKQVFRNRNYDVVGLAGESLSGEPLLVKFMEKGEVVRKLPSLEDSRNYFLDRFSEIPEKLKDIRKRVEYPIRISAKLEALYAELSQVLEKRS